MGIRKHSPAPWNTDSSKNYILNPKCEVILNLPHSTYKVEMLIEGSIKSIIKWVSNEDENFANLQLILASPYLLDVVEQYLDGMVGTASEGSLAWTHALTAYELASGMKYENFIINPDKNTDHE